MIQGNEVVMLVIGGAVFIFSLAYKHEIRRIPHWKILLTAFYILLGAWTVTIVEGFLWAAVFNVLENICYACSALLLLFWCWKISFGPEVQFK